MADTPPLWQSCIYGVLVHPATGEVLLVDDGTNPPQLPYVVTDKPVWRADIESVSALLQPCLPVSFHVLRYIAAHRDASKRRIALVYLLEPAGHLPERTWVDPVDLLLADLLPVELHPGLETWLDELNQGIIPVNRPPWAMPGWHAQAEAWIRSQLGARGLGELCQLETIKNWGISCVIRVTSSQDGTYFFKASRPLPLFAEEGAITEKLAEHFPEYVARPVAIDREKRWLLVPRQGDSLPWSPPVELHEAVYRLLANLQIAAIPHVEALLQAGCLDRRLPTLARQVPALFKDDLALARLKMEERTRLEAALPRFLEGIAALQALSFPDTLVHGDFHTGNIAVRNGQYFIFDWSDASIGHPFMDLLSLGDQTNEARRNRVRDAYLAGWQVYFPWETLLEAYHLAQVVYPLYHAVNYQAIYHNLEPTMRSELDIVPELLRLALQNLEEEQAHLTGA